MHQLDVKFPFFNGLLKEEIYALRTWNRRTNSFLSQIGFKKCTSTHGFYVKCWKDNVKSEKLIVCLYVDDILITSSSEEAIFDFKWQMMNEFEMSDLGLLSYFLGIEFKIT
ncbi:Copia protein, partial [Mucuna pruriens]